MKIRLTPQDLRGRLGDASLASPAYGKYVRQLINLANQIAKATIPNRVGQMTELIRECPARNFDGWRDWYLDRYPTAIDEATNRVVSMLERLRDTMDDIDRETVRRWVTELVLEQTYVGLRVERAILEEAAHRLNRTLRLSSPEDESQGIDGYLDGRPVSVKPTTYQAMDRLNEAIDARMIYYEKKSNGTIVIDLDGVERP